MYTFYCMNLANSKSNFSFPLSDNSIRGSRGSPHLNPILFIAYFIGIGFTSANKAFISGRANSWEAQAFCQLPVK